MRGLVYNGAARPDRPKPDRLPGGTIEVPIKLRILLCVLGLQIIGFGLLIAYQASQAETAMAALRTQQVAAVFDASLREIDATTGLIERSVLDLATAGETFHLLAGSQPADSLEAPIRRQLIAHFERFPAALGGGLWYEPRQFDPQAERYGPYAFRRDDEVVFTWDLNSESYDYPRQQWYLHGLPADWPRDRPREQAVYWTEPYYDEAGSLALMMSAVAPMRDAGGRLIGVATVDWSMEAMRAQVAGIRVTPGAGAFLLDRRSGRFVSFTLDDHRVMQPAANLDWTASLLAGSAEGMGELASVRYGSRDYRVYYRDAGAGLLFGVMLPHEEVLAEVQQMRDRTLLTGVLIALGFLLAMAIALAYAFRPFSRVLALIGDSIRHGDDGTLRLTPVTYTAGNEFDPIIKALNEVYAAVDAYTRRLSEANQHLSEQRSEIEQLNASLEQKVAERTRELAAKNSELQASLRELGDTQQQLFDAEKHAALNRLVAGIAHEVNTPLGVALTAGSHLAEEARRLETLLASGNIRRSELDAFVEECRESLGIIEFNLDRAASLVRGFKQISVDQSSEARRCFALGDYIADILLSLRPQLKRTRIEVRVDCPPAVVIDSYPGAFSQVLANLVMNSLAHGFTDGEAGRIDIDVSMHDDGVRLRYADNGRGIEPAHLSQIFDPFFTTNRQGGGSGLGLHIVYNLVTRKMGGQVHCESAPGAGVRFVLELPLSAPEPSANAEAADEPVVSGG